MAHRRKRPRRVLGVLGLTLGLGGVTLGVGNSVGTAAPSQDRLGYDFVVTDDGTYIWFTDDRAIVKDRTLLAGYVQFDGTAAMTSVDLATGRRLSQDIALRKWPKGDDHAGPALLAMNNDRVGVFYTGHDWGGEGKMIYWRISEPGIPTQLSDLGAEREKAPTINGAPVLASYSNPIQLSGEDDRIYNFVRLDTKHTYFTTYDRDGTAESAAPVQLVKVEVDDWKHRPYVKYASNGVDRIDMVFTNGHPTLKNLNLYHAYYQGGNLYTSDGTLIGNVVEDGPFTLDQMTEVYVQDDQDANNKGYTPWNHDLKIGPDGNPVLVYSRQLDPYTLDYQYATYRPDTNEWVHTRVADAGDSLIPTKPIDPYNGQEFGGAQPHYTGGIVLNPTNVNEVFISANVNPITGAATDKFEIYRGESSNGSFTWTAITQNSPENNYRPVIPTGASYDDQVVIWFTGKYDSFVNEYKGEGPDRHFYIGYDTRIVGRYLHRGFEQPDDDYAIDLNGPNAITAAGFRPIEGSGQSTLVTERATIAVTNAAGSRERDGVDDDQLRDFGFAYADLDVSIADLTPGSYQFSLTSYDLWNDQDVAIEFFPTGSAPVTVVASHSQTDPSPVNFAAVVKPDTDYTLRVRRLGNRATVLNSFEITPLGDAKVPPVASFEPGTSMNVGPGTRVTFDGSASFDPDGGPLQYVWRSTGMNGTVTGPTFTRTFTTAGRNGVELTVIDDEGETAQKHINVWVKAKGAPPVAKFEPGTSMDVEANTTLTFDGSTSFDPDGGPLQYVWRSTGMNGTVTGPTFTRTFTTPGRTGVELEVIDQEGQRDRKHINVWVTSVP